MGVSSCLGPLLMLGVPSAVASSIKLAMIGISGGETDALRAVIIRSPGSILFLWLIGAAETMLRVEDAVLDMATGITVVTS
ncbi:MAG: hypothetical protein J3Q66DRAFT_349094 [Benniella sp.]|nr:MAG: hypothetical protein J3Q66DRAFT_349094 [Benniella sp.]